MVKYELGGLLLEVSPHAGNISLHEITNEEAYSLNTISERGKGYILYLGIRKKVLRIHLQLKMAIYQNEYQHNTSTEEKAVCIPLDMGNI